MTQSCLGLFLLKLSYILDTHRSVFHAVRSLWCDEEQLCRKDFMIMNVRLSALLQKKMGRHTEGCIKNVGGGQQVEAVDLPLCSTLVRLSNMDRAWNTRY